MKFLRVTGTPRVRYPAPQTVRPVDLDAYPVIAWLILGRGR